MRHSLHPRPTLNVLVEIAGDIARGILSGFARIGEARAKSRRVSRLWALTDAELQVRGLRREDIVRLVMADVI